MAERVLVVGEQAHARALRDGGAEVIFLTGAEPAHVASVAVQEDVDAVVTADVSATADALAEHDAADIEVRAPAG